MEKKARKVKKTKKTSKAPIYILIIAVIIIFTLLAIGVYVSLGTVNPNLIVMVVVIIIATIIIELMMKRNIYFEGWFDNKDEDETSRKPKDRP